MTHKDSDELMERVHDSRHEINGLLGDIQTLKMKLAEAHPEGEITYEDVETDVLDLKSEMVHLAGILLDDAQSLNSWVNFNQFGAAAQAGAESAQFDAAAEAIAANIEMQRHVYWPNQVTSRDFEEAPMDSRGVYNPETVEWTHKFTKTLHDGTKLHICLDESGRSV